jgi:hypothetical protein
MHGAIIVQSEHQIMARRNLCNIDAFSHAFCTSFVMPGGYGSRVARCRRSEDARSYRTEEKPKTVHLGPSALAVLTTTGCADEPASSMPCTYSCSGTS